MYKISAISAAISARETFSNSGLNGKGVEKCAFSTENTAISRKRGERLLLITNRKEVACWLSNDMKIDLGRPWRSLTSDNQCGQLYSSDSWASCLLILRYAVKEDKIKSIASLIAKLSMAALRGRARWFEMTWLEDPTPWLSPCLGNNANRKKMFTTSQISDRVSLFVLFW